MPSPTFAAEAFAASASTTSSWSASGTYTRLIAEQTWPLLANAASKSFAATSAGVGVVEDDGRVVAAELEGDPLQVGCGRQRRRACRWPTEPVKLTLRGVGCAVIHCPRLVAAGDDVEHAGGQHARRSTSPMA